MRRPTCPWPGPEALYQNGGAWIAAQRRRLAGVRTTMLGRPWDDSLIRRDLAADARRGSHVAMKPRGLWYALDADWLAFLLEESWRDRWGGFLYAVTVDRDRILRVTTETELHALHRHLGVPNEDGAALALDWGPVRRRFDGIEFSVHPREVTYLTEDEELWYSAFGAKSGCVWRARSIVGHRAIRCQSPATRGSA